MLKTIENMNLVVKEKRRGVRSVRGRRFLRGKIGDDTKEKGSRKLDRSMGERSRFYG